MADAEGESKTEEVRQTTPTHAVERGRHKALPRSGIPRIIFFGNKPHLSPAPPPKAANSLLPALVIPSHARPLSSPNKIQPPAAEPAAEEEAAPAAEEEAAAEPAAAAEEVREFSQLSHLFRLARPAYHNSLNSGARECMGDTTFTDAQHAHPHSPNNTKHTGSRG